jgi:hypothetical protein
VCVLELGPHEDLRRHVRDGVADAVDERVELSALGDADAAGRGELAVDGDVVDVVVAGRWRVGLVGDRVGDAGHGRSEGVLVLELVARPERRAGLVLVVDDQELGTVVPAGHDDPVAA